MLSESERAGIVEAAKHYDEPASAVGDALMIVQESRGWVSDEAVADLAGALGLSVEDVDAVATFSDLVFRRPVGRNVILVCDSVSCWITGYEGVIAHLRSRLGIDLGQTTADGRFTLLPVGCLGACEQGPAMMVNGELIGNLTPARIDEALARHSRDGVAGHANANQGGGYGSSDGKKATD
jgi:NADH-quinone oxidoreductase subunit E